MRCSRDTMASAPPHPTRQLPSVEISGLFREGSCHHFRTLLELKNTANTQPPMWCHQNAVNLHICMQLLRTEFCWFLSPFTKTVSITEDIGVRDHRNEFSVVHTAVWTECCLQKAGSPNHYCAVAFLLLFSSFTMTSNNFCSLSPPPRKKENDELAQRSKLILLPRLKNTFSY